LLSEVWLALTRGQETLAIEHAAAPRARTLAARDAGAEAAEVARIRVVAPSAAELAAHDAYLASIERDSDGHCLWLQLLRAEPAAA
ncbi:MAG TPA: DNA polymerase III subunit epsilon, partial [Casimicrobiaceae bacterium]